MEDSIESTSYRSTGASHGRPIFWAAPNSAFSGKLRSFLIKSGADYEERFPTDPRFEREILPKIGYWVIPVIELGDGTLLQDSTEAMLHFEQRSLVRRSLLPRTPLLFAVAHMLNFFGTDGFIKPGMHYRWSYLSEQKVFLESAFTDWISSSLSSEQRSERLSQIMGFFNSYSPTLGITPDTKAVIEESWTQGLDALNRHFSVCPYLLGNAPSIADCGLMTMLGPHLSRDPVPANLMRTRAPMVSRWVERMVQPAVFDGGFPNAGPELDANDEVPPSLLPFLHYLFADVVPEVAATVDGFNRWIDERSTFRSGDSLDDPAAQTAHPTCGEISFNLKGQPVRRLAFVDTVYQFQQFRRIVLGLPRDAIGRFEALLEIIGGRRLIDLSQNQAIRYEGYRYKLA